MQSRKQVIPQAHCANDERRYSKWKIDGPLDIQSWTLRALQLDERFGHTRRAKAANENRARHPKRPFVRDSIKRGCVGE